MRVAVEATAPADMGALAAGLDLLHRADPLAEVTLQPSGEHVLGAAGRMQSASDTSRMLVLQRGSETQQQSLNDSPCLVNCVATCDDSPCRRRCSQDLCESIVAGAADQHDAFQHTKRFWLAGEVHLETCIQDLRERFARVELTVSPPLVAFRESVADPAEAPEVVHRLPKVCCGHASSCHKLIVLNHRLQPVFCGVRTLYGLHGRPIGKLVGMTQRSRCLLSSICSAVSDHVSHVQQ